MNMLKFIKQSPLEDVVVVFFAGMLACSLTVFLVGNGELGFFKWLTGSFLMGVCLFASMFGLSAFSNAFTKHYAGSDE